MIGKVKKYSRLFHYYNERNLEKNIESDTGGKLANGFIVLNKFGICEEHLWTHDKDITEKPSEECFNAAKKLPKYVVKKVHKNIEEIKYHLNNNRLLAVDMNLFKSFPMSNESDNILFNRTGIVPIPDETCIHSSGHAVVCVGYNDDYELLIMRNSWGTSWGDNGYFYIPYGALKHDTFIETLYCITGFTTNEKLLDKQEDKLEKDADNDDTIEGRGLRC
jgi:C1A family cysteine protease